MNKKEKKLELVKELRNEFIKGSLDIYQDKPWTFVMLECFHQGKYMETFGFSKVCHPDEWDADYGVELAITKALYKLAKEILGKEK